MPVPLFATMQSLCIILLVLVVAGWAYWLAAWGCTRAFFSRSENRAGAASSPGQSGFQPRVSVLKPVKGVDAEAYENFTSFCKQDFPSFEILFAVADADDPAADMVRRLAAEFSQVPIRLIVAGPLGANPKCANLHQLAAEAGGEVLVLSDGDIRVGSDYLARVVAPLADTSVGLVTCPYCGLFPRGLPAQLEALHMEVLFLPAVILAYRLGERVGLGATMALRRDDLVRAGGFAAIADHLMDDYQLAASIEGLGLRTCLCDYVVGSVLGRVRFGQQWDREVRWARGIRVTCPGKYWGLLLTFPTPWALALCLAGGIRLWTAIVFALTLLLRWLIAWDVQRRLAAPLAGRFPSAEHRLHLYLLPLRDLLSFAVWSAGLLGNRITWRGQQFKLRRDGRLEPGRQRHDLFSRAVRALDRFLRRRQGIFEYSNADDCLFRVSIGVCDHALQLADGTQLSPGDAVCDLHLFNDHVPPIGPQGAGVAWAGQMQRGLRSSLKTLAAALEIDRRFDDVKAFRAQSVIVASRGIEQMQRFASRLHFDLLDDDRRSAWKRVHDMGENILVWALVRTYNPGALGNARLMRTRRWLFMSRQTLIKCYGKKSHDPAIS